MILFKLLFTFLIFFVCLVYADWVAEWMGPVRDQLTFNDDVFRRNSEFKMPEVTAATIDSPAQYFPEKEGFAPQAYATAGNLQTKLDATLTKAKALADTIKTQILKLNARETLLKEAIANGRLGVSTVTVSTLSQGPRSYIIREGQWILCNGIIETPASTHRPAKNLFGKLFSEPRCLGSEVYTAQDPCVFNSVIKYTVVPTTRATEYIEDDYLCLKQAFNITLERYMSVPKQIVDQTCKNGIIRNLSDHKLECGVRTLSEYSFYPHRSSSAAVLPLEYCIETDGSCNLVVAWHVSNATVENFEFLKNDKNFKKYFINNGAVYVEHAI